MKKLLLIFIALPMIGFGQNVNIPDINFKAYLVGNTAINTNGDSEIQVSEASVFNGAFLCGGMNIADLTGIQAFILLDTLKCNDNQLTSIDVSNMPNLIHLVCSFNQLTNLNISGATALTFLDCGGNQLTSLDVSLNTALLEIWCNYNQLTSLELSNNTALTFLSCYSNQLTSLNVSGATALTQLSCSNSQLTILDVSTNTALTHLSCNSNQLTSLDVSGATALAYLVCRYNQLTSLDVSGATSLAYLDCRDNFQLKCLDISGATNLNELKCNDMLLEQLNTKNGNWQNLQIDALNNNLTCVEVDNLGYANNNWVGSFDGFVTFSTDCNYANPCTTVSSIQELSTNKELLKVTDLLGRETKGTKNEILFYIYDDGTVEKRIVIE
jgi:hypothetical protein